MKPDAPATPTPASAANPLVYLKLTAVALLWGGTFIAGKLAAQAVPPLSAATGRFAVAVALLLVLAWKVEGGLPRLDRRQLAITFCLGLTGIFLYNLFFLGALSRIPAGRSALFVALNPIVTALALAALFGERLGALRWAGIAIALAGAVVVITRGAPLEALHDIGRSLGTGELMMFGAISSWAAYTIIGRFALRGLTPLAATTWAALWGLGLLLCGAAFELPGLDWNRVTWPVLGAIAYLGAFGTVIGFVWYYEGVHAIGPARTAVFNNLVPVFGMLLAAGLLGEPILASMLVGGALVIAGVSLTNRVR
ncbi:DMT family transporter [Pseudomonas sp. PDM13]|uniref:DMT family transporter n=1 Tax=Pseudomonas sp. PDM13 TaxID=2769255 RepID=UPI0021E0B050|nr:DMT family transporter [Pseudomonas sp. PDM13]MCU9947582.1 DMT family transporter [Pseudomonas sp. PDM13]